MTSDNVARAGPVRADDPQPGDEADELAAQARGRASVAGGL
ncbi:hypothetical protein [Streptomyces sp. NPDC001933]